MHYAHVKRKENPVKPITIQSVRINPEILGVLEARAKRARAQAVHSLIVRLIERFSSRGSGHASGNPLGIRWG